MHMLLIGLMSLHYVVLACFLNLGVESVLMPQSSCSPLLTPRCFGLRERQSITAGIPSPQGILTNFWPSQQFCKIISPFSKYIAKCDFWLICPSLSLCLQNWCHILELNERKMTQHNKTDIQAYGTTENKPLQNYTTMKTWQLSFHQHSHKCIWCKHHFHIILNSGILRLLQSWFIKLGHVMQLILVACHYLWHLLQ